MVLVEQGHALAQEGDLAEAITKFEEAVQLDETLDLAALRAEATKTAAMALVEQGRALAQEGDLTGAIAKFEEARRLDKTLNVTGATMEAQALAARALAEQGSRDEASEILVGLASQTPRLATDLPVTATTALTPLWHFTATAGQVITITMVDTEDGSFDPYLTLIGPVGELVDEDDDSGAGSDGYDAQLAAVQLPAAGVYFVLAGRADSTVVYALTLTTTAAPSTTAPP